MTKPQLIVEGRDDLFLIANLLQKNGVNMVASSRPIEIIERRSVELLLESLNASFLDHKSPFALPFLKWMHALFDIIPNMGKTSS